MSIVGHNSFPFADGNAGHVVDLGSAPSAGDIDIIVVISVTVINSVTAFGSAIDTHLNADDVKTYYRVATGSELSTFTVTTNGDFATVVWWQRWRGLSALDTHNLAVLDQFNQTQTPAGDTGTLATNTDVVAVFAVSSATQSANQVGDWVGSPTYVKLDETHLDSSTFGIYGASGYKLNAGTTHETPQYTWSGDGAFHNHTASLAFTLAAGGTSFPRTVADTVSISDSVARTAVHPRSVADSVPVSDGTSVGSPTARTATDTVPITDAVTRGPSVRARSVSDTLSISDSTSPPDRVTFLSVRPVPSTWSVRYLGVPMQQSVLALDWARYAVRSSADPTSDAVQFAFVQPGMSPTSGDWVSGSWESAVLSTGEHVARVLVGPGGTIALARGIWSVWIRITDNPTRPVWNVGTLSTT